MWYLASRVGFVKGATTPGYLLWCRRYFRQTGLAVATTGYHRIKHLASMRVLCHQVIANKRQGAIRTFGTPVQPQLMLALVMMAIRIKIGMLTTTLARDIKCPRAAIEMRTVVPLLTPPSPMFRELVMGLPGEVLPCY